MEAEASQVHRYVLVVDRGDPRRLTGLVVAAVYTEPGSSTKRLAFFHLEEPPGDLPGRAMGRRIAELVAALDGGVPVHVMCGVTLDGKKFAREIIIPSVYEALKDSGTPRAVTWETYAAHVRGGVREVGRKITLSERIGSLSIALELRTIVLPKTVPLAESVLRALKNYDPTGAVVEDGTDKWNAIEHEGIITALAAAHTTMGEAALYTPRGTKDNPTLAAPGQPVTTFKNHPTVGVPVNYVDAGIAGRISGTAVGGSGGGVGGRWGGPR